MLEQSGSLIAVEPTSIEFGNVIVGSSAEREITVQNNGTAAVSGEVVPAGDFTSSGFVLESGGGSFTLSGGETRNVVVALKPGSATPKTSSLEILHDAQNISSPVTVELTGQGVTATPAILLNETAIDFGSVVVGDYVEVGLVVTNTGQGTLSGEVSAGTGFTSNGFVFSSGQGAYSLSAGESATAKIRFKPGSVGNKQAAVLVSHSASSPGSPITVTLLGVGAQGDAQIAVEPIAIDFGEVEVGSTRIDCLFVRHIGGSDRLIGSVSDFGDITGIGIYYASGGGLFDISPGGVHTTRLAFAPTKEGPVSTRIKVNHNARNMPTNVLIDVKGSGVVAQPKALLGLSVSDTLDFGQVPVGSIHTQSFVISNNGGATLNTSLSLQGSASFKASGPGAIDIAGGATTTVEVSFEPVQTGSVESKLRILHNDKNLSSPYEIVLVGVGISAGELGAPQLIEPPNGSIPVSMPVLFRWNPAVTAESYILQLSTSSDFSSSVTQQETDTTLVTIDHLQTNTSYFWRVMARRSEIQSTSNTWSFTLRQANRAPVAVTDSVSTLSGQTIRIEVLTNDYDEDGHALRVTGITEQPLNGIAIAFVSRVDYRPNPGFVGLDRFIYEIADSFGLTSTAQVYVSVGTGTGIGEDLLPGLTTISDVYPNPVSGSCWIHLSVSEQMHMRLTVYDGLERRVAVPLDRFLSSGQHTLEWNAVGLSAGMYLLVMEYEGGRQAKGLLVAH